MRKIVPVILLSLCAQPAIAQSDWQQNVTDTQQYLEQKTDDATQYVKQNNPFDPAQDKGPGAVQLHPNLSPQGNGNTNNYQ